MDNCKKYLKPALAVLLLLCLADMPYGFYELVRFVAMIGFAVIAYGCYKSGRSGQAVVFGALALLFQPFAKIGLGRELWNLVDVAAAVALIVLWAKERKRQGK